MEKIQSQKQSFKAPDIAEKYLQLKDHDHHGMLEDIAYVYPKGKKPEFVVNSLKHKSANIDTIKYAIAGLIILFFPTSIYLGTALTLLLLITIIATYYAFTTIIDKKQNQDLEENHPEMAVFDNGIWFYRYNTFIPFERFFRVWVMNKYGSQNIRQIMFEIYLNNKDVKSVIERMEMLGYEQFFIDKNLHHKTKLNNVLSIRLPYRDGAMDYTHDEIVEKISTLIKRNAYDNALPVDIGIERKNKTQDQH